MAFNSYRSLITEGLAANRPATPEITDLRQFFYATDTGALSMWSPKNAAWALLQSNGAIVDTAVTAATVQTRAAATQLTGTYNNLTVVANSGDAVGLPPITAIGQQVWVTNAGANPAKVFPDNGTPGASTTIDGGAAAASVTVTNAKSALFTATTLTNWQTIGSAARAA